jgi:hypothetical protein
MEKENVERVPKELHDGPAGGHFAGETMAHKILRVGIIGQIYLGTLIHMSESVQVCQMSTGKEKKDSYSTLASVNFQAI